MRPPRLPLRPPSGRDWQARAAWFAHRTEALGDAGPRTGALLAELERVFCAGAWLAAVVLAQTVVEAAMQEADDGWAEVTLSRDLLWLRDRRNSLVHHDTDAPPVTLHDLEADAAALERDARRAVGLMAVALGGRPGG
jgi:hypothetical protein